MAAGSGPAPVTNVSFQNGTNEIPLVPGGQGKNPGTFALCTFGQTPATNGATPVTVAAAAVTANSIIIFTLKTVGGTVSPNMPNVLTITPGTGFTYGGTASDTSIYNYVIIG